MLDMLQDMSREMPSGTAAKQVEARLCKLCKSLQPPKRNSGAAVSGYKMPGRLSYLIVIIEVTKP